MFDTMFKGVPAFAIIYNWRLIEFAMVILFVLSCVYLLSLTSQKANVQKIMFEKRRERAEAMKKDPKTTS